MQEHPDMSAVVFMKHGNRLRQGAFANYLEGIDRAGLSDLYKISYSPMKLTNITTGQIILFLGLDDPNKTKGVTSGNNTRLCIAHFEELDQFSGNREIETALDSIIRGCDTYWCFQCYNPPANVNNWVNKDSLINVPDRLVHHSDYRTVPVEWLGTATLSRIANCYKRSEREYRWRYLGEAVGVEGLVFQNVTQIDISVQTPPIDMLFQGIDFGWNDPKAFVKVGFNLAYHDIYILDEVYASRMFDTDFAKLMIAHNCMETITIAECSNGDEKLAPYQQMGIPMSKVNKGNNLKLNGINFLNNCNHIYIDPYKTPNAWEEFNLYEWKKDKDGNVISPECPVDGNDHCIDATRYALSKHIKLLGGAI